MTTANNIANKINVPVKEPLISGRCLPVNNSTLSWSTRSPLEKKTLILSIQPTLHFGYPMLSRLETML